jgi:starch phosphorylase
MEVDEARAAARSSSDGRTFFFCSAGCKAAFDQAPGDYVALLERVPASMPRLLELARNLWWSWHSEARALFEALSDTKVEPPHPNPIQLLLATAPELVMSRARDPELEGRYRRVLAAFDAETAARGSWAASDPRLSGVTVAYFSAEFGVHSALPVYSGGLGVLAGDITKEASDLGIPLTGVGFMYPQGYFHQHLSPDGRQEETYERLHRPVAPAEPACTYSGRPCVVALALPDRELHAAVWLVRMGRVPLYLMDTDVEGNPPRDRELSARLYGGDHELRLRQEMLLGVGGVRLLRALGVAPVVWHANEGHSAFMMLERTRELVEAGASFDRAAEEIKASTVFTTHTPVPAGHDAFPFPLIEKYFAKYWPSLGLDRERFLALGATEGPWGSAFNMTALALRLSGHRNAVSRRHGEVSRRMWRSLWPSAREDDVPIISVTNGVHVPTWVAPEFARVFQTYLGQEWLSHHDDASLWERVSAIPDRELWDAHRRLKERLVMFVRDRARRRWAEESGASRQVIAAGALLDADVLTLGFARRFATYKRASLILRDRARLRAILTDARCPVQIVFAGKAHPADEPGKDMLAAVYRAALDPAYAGRVAFVEEYDMHVAQHLVQGVDVWLNSPRPPLEASGTSGQKAAMNGVLNLSVLDGWWAEAYDGSNGWAIAASAGEAADDGAQDAADAEALYRLLETQVVPAYYRRDEAGLPRDWLPRMRAAIRTVVPRFSARRMVKEYAERLYLQAARPPRHG